MRETTYSTDDFLSLVGRIKRMSEILQQDVLQSINRSVTARAWMVGCYIVEYEQKGKDRAKYGVSLLKNLSKSLGCSCFSESALKKYRLFYLTYPELISPIKTYLAEHRLINACSAKQSLLSKIEIGQSAIAQSVRGQLQFVWKNGPILRHSARFVIRRA